MDKLWIGVLCVFTLFLPTARRRLADHGGSDVQTTYFSGPSGGTINVSSEGESICKIFAWADIGIMGGIWLVLLIGQFYFIL